MRQRFFAAARPQVAATVVHRLGRRSDVYVGACPRARRRGTRDALAGGWALWADCDGPQAVAAAQAFSPAPAIVVRSGTGPNVHAYWPLSEPLAPDALERANRRLAAALGADPASTDPGRVLRPPGTLNFKHDPPVVVSLEAFTGERHDTAALLAALAPEHHDETPAAARRRAGRPTQRRVDDPLRTIDPDVYVAALTGQQPNRDRKVSCPFHRDRTPSLHAYEAPEDGWFCFGCRRGRDVYDLGGGVMGLATRGRGFLELRGRLYELLLHGHGPPTPRHDSDPRRTPT